MVFAGKYVDECIAALRAYEAVVEAPTHKSSQSILLPGIQTIVQICRIITHHPGRLLTSRSKMQKPLSLDMTAVYTSITQTVRTTSSACTYAYTYTL